MSHLTLFIHKHLLIGLLALLQFSAGELAITLLDAHGAAVPGAVVVFLTETGTTLASCVTDDSGACLLQVERAPADASGLIRGALTIQGRGLRPVIWPGGTLTLSLKLDEAGQLPIAHDVYATRVPGLVIPTAASLSIPTANPVTAEPARPTVPNTVPSPVPTGTEPSASAATAPRISWIPIAVGIVGLCLGVVYYAWRDARREGRG